jgi:hypothetical protein
VDSAVGDLGGQVSRRRRERDVERTHETYEMEPTVPVFRVLEAGEDGLVLIVHLFLGQDVDADDVSPDDAPGADVQVSSQVHLIISLQRLEAG